MVWTAGSLWSENYFPCFVHVLEVASFLARGHISQPLLLLSQCPPTLTPLGLGVPLWLCCCYLDSPGSSPISQSFTRSHLQAPTLSQVLGDKTWTSLGQPHSGSSRFHLPQGRAQHLLIYGHGTCREGGDSEAPGCTRRLLPDHPLQHGFVFS